MNLFEIDLARTAPRLLPQEVARDTFLIRDVTPSVGNSWTNLNSMVICAAEPVIIDTGMETNREAWFQDIASLVAPDEVRWLYITHTDCDHAGNLVEALARFPNASLVLSRGESYRAAACFKIPFERITAVDNGHSFDVGDRILHAIRPPVYDSPYTRGLYDPTTGVYYASDAFCAPSPGEPADWVAGIPEDQWADGMARFHHSSLCPWVAMVDREIFRAEVGKLDKLDLKVIASAHSPPIDERSIPGALAQMAGLPDAIPPTAGRAA